MLLSQSQRDIAFYETPTCMALKKWFLSLVCCFLIELQKKTWVSLSLIIMELNVREGFFSLYFLWRDIALLHYYKKKNKRCSWSETLTAHIVNASVQTVSDQKPGSHVYMTQCPASFLSKQRARQVSHNQETHLSYSTTRMFSVQTFYQNMVKTVWSHLASNLHLQNQVHTDKNRTLQNPAIISLLFGHNLTFTGLQLAG